MSTQPITVYLTCQEFTDFLNQNAEMLARELGGLPKRYQLSNAQVRRIARQHPGPFVKEGRNWHVADIEHALLLIARRRRTGAPRGNTNATGSAPKPVEPFA